MISNDKKKSINDVLNKINKKFGEGTVNVARDVVDKLKIHYFKTPSYLFNIMLHGGFAEGRIIELYGENSSGKTSLMIETIVLNQHLNPNFVAGWFETENSVDEDQLKMFGVDMDRLVYWDQKETGAEQGFDVLRGLVSSGQFNMIVVNSVAGICPKTEIEDDLEKSNIALSARLMSKLFRVITGAAAKNKTTLVFINQTRSKVGVMFGNPETTTGGKALQFYASQRVRMSKIKIAKEDPITEEEGVKIRCHSMKNRTTTGNPYTTCEYYAIYGEGIDSISELPGILEDNGILQKAGSWYYWKDENGQVINFHGLECKFKSKKVLINALKSNKQFKKQMEELVDKTLSNGKAKSVSMTQEEIEAAVDENQKIETEVGNEEGTQLGMDDEIVYNVEGEMVHKF
jgi:recombination protein RecA